ncbi:MAG TPA: ribonuclease HII [Myxococcota bacterium]|nr:ribonuclease HII [Myxococcota bacterium]
MEIRRIGLAELRRRYTPEGVMAPPGLLRALREDERAGARALADELEARREQRAKERRRVLRLWRLERELLASGFARIAGCDEVGMGPLAGPVIAAAVVLPAGFAPAGLDDSKRVRAELREKLEAEIRASALACALGCVEPEEIDRVNIYRAGHLAIRRAVLALGAPPDAVVVDGRRVPDLPGHQVAVIGGDARVASIAAASIVAKVHRDRLMQDADRAHPGYGFARHVGYSTPEHLAALQRLGPSPIHRRSFAPVRGAPCPTP